MRRIELTYSADDFVAAQWLHRRPRPVFKVLWGFLVAIGLFAVAVMIAETSSGKENSIVGLAVLTGATTFLSLMFFVYCPWHWRRLYRQQKTLHFPITVEFDEDGYRTNSERGNCVMKWSDFIRYKRNENFLLLYQTDVMMNLVPRRQFLSEAVWNELIDLVSRNVASEIR